MKLIHDYPFYLIVACRVFRYDHIFTSTILFTSLLSIPPGSNKCTPVKSIPCTFVGVLQSLKNWHKESSLVLSWSSSSGQSEIVTHSIHDVHVLVTCFCMFKSHAMCCWPLSSLFSGDFSVHYESDQASTSVFQMMEFLSFCLRLDGGG